MSIEFTRFYAQILARGFKPNGLATKFLISDEDQNITFIHGARGTGKTTLGILKLLSYCHKYPNRTFAVFSSDASYRFNAHIREEINKWARITNWDSLTIRLENGARIHNMSGLSKYSSLNVGLGHCYALLDEPFDRRALDEIMNAGARCVWVATRSKPFSTIQYSVPGSVIVLSDSLPTLLGGQLSSE